MAQQKSHDASGREKILVVDSTKFDQTAFSVAGKLRDVDVVVTDRKPSDKWMGYFKDAGVKCLYPDMQHRKGATDMKTFEMKTAIHFGENALERLENIPYKRVLIITDPFVVQSKMIDLITRPLEKAGKEYDIFHNVVPDAPVDKIADGVKKFLSYQPEAIIAVGGGSAIDSSKAIREFA